MSDYEWKSKYVSDVLIPVRKNKKYGYVDRYDKLIVSYEYDVAMDFYNGLFYAVVGKYHNDDDCNEMLFGIIDDTGNEIIPCKYGDIYYLTPYFFIAKPLFPEPYGVYDYQDKIRFRCKEKGILKNTYDTIEITNYNNEVFDIVNDKILDKLNYFLEKV